MDADGSVYVGSGGSDWPSPGSLYAYGPDGKLKWSFKVAAPRKWDSRDINGVESAPTITPRGDIAVAAGDRLHLLDRQGKLKWSVRTGTPKVVDLGEGPIRRWLGCSPALAADGTIYFASGEGKLYAVRPDGRVAWTFQGTGVASASLPGAEGPVAVGPDGTIYFATDVYPRDIEVGGAKVTVYAISPGGKEAWHYAIRYGRPSQSGGVLIAVGADGTVYLGAFDGRLRALRPDGTLKWKRTTDSVLPAVGDDGTIYTGGRRLCAVSPNGETQWRFTAPGMGDMGVCTPVLTADGTVFVASFEGRVYAVTRAGAQLWARDINVPVSSLAIMKDGAIYAGGVVLRDKR